MRKVLCVGFRFVENGEENFGLMQMRHADRCAMPTDSQAKLASCRGIRRMHLRLNVPARVRAPGSQFGSYAHGSLLAHIFTLFMSN